ncbi:MAG: cysteinyl-tRNA synthetase, partial [Candidatus Saccharimonadales bacterium]
DPMVALKKLTDKYTEVFKQDLESTGNNLDALQFISAVDTIPEMIKLTQTILDNGIGYIADDGVYFSITKYYKAGYRYGILQKIATQQSKARISNDEYDKDNAGDFALWKRAQDGEPQWPATFSEDLMETEMAGRPGWHIECSAMSEKTLGTPFDVHTGGIDLKFPHHENEIAQSCAAGSTDFANYFVHNNHILVDGKKMSKSLNNFFTLRDIEQKGYSAQAFRLLVLESHYSSESNFSWDILTASQNRLKNWQASVDTLLQLPEDDDTSVVELLKVSLADNLNTPRTLKEVDTYFDKVSSRTKSPNKSVIEAIKNVLGIDLTATDIEENVRELISARAEARSAKQWAKSDEIREQLSALGYGVRDLKDQQIWHKL